MTTETEGFKKNDRMIPTKWSKEWNSGIYKLNKIYLKNRYQKEKWLIKLRVAETA